MIHTPGCSSTQLPKSSHHLSSVYRLGPEMTILAGVVILPAVSVSIVLLLSSYLSLLLALDCVWLNVMMLGLGRDLVTPSCKRCWALVLVCLGSEHIRSLSIKPDGPQLERKILLNISRVQIWLLRLKCLPSPAPANWGELNTNFPISGPIQI